MLIEKGGIDIKRIDLFREIFQGLYDNDFLTNDIEYEELQRLVVNVLFEEFDNKQIIIGEIID